MFVPNFKILGQVVPEKSFAKNIGEIEKRKIEKDLAKNNFSILVLFTEIHLVVFIV